LRAHGEAEEAWEEMSALTSSHLGRPVYERVPSDYLGRPKPASDSTGPLVVGSESVAVKRRWRREQWSDVDGPMMRLWDLWEALPGIGMRVAKLLLGIIVGPLWKSVCEAALRDQPERGTTINVNTTLSSDAPFVFVYIGDHNYICADPAALLTNMEGRK
jgi:hypothetical protein